MDIQNIKLSDMKPLQNNIRVHGENQIKHYIKSLKQFGQTKPIILDDDYNILIGNGLHKAMTQMGLEVAQAYIKSGLSEKDKKKLILADNKVYELGMTSNSEIEKYLKEITDLGDFDIVGYEEDILKSIMATSDEIIDDMMKYGAFEEPIVQPIQQPTEQQIPQPMVQPIPQPMVQPSEGQIVQPMEGQIQANNFQQQTQQADIVRTIICPSCGEVIRLD